MQKKSMNGTGVFSGNYVGQCRDYIQGYLPVLTGARHGIFVEVEPSM
jgi:hypothetical protein